MYFQLFAWSPCCFRLFGVACCAALCGKLLLHRWVRTCFRFLLQPYLQSVCTHLFLCQHHLFSGAFRVCFALGFFFPRPMVAVFQVICPPLPCTCLLKVTPERD